MKHERGRRAWHIGRVALGWTVAVIALTVAGCGGMVTATPVGSFTVSDIGAPESEPSTTLTGTGSSTGRSATGSSSAAQPNLVVDIDVSVTSPAPSEVDLVTSISSILGDVEELSMPPDGPDTYVAMLDGRYRVSMTLPGATAQQLDAARRSLVGSRSFALRPVTRGAVDARACAALQTAPKPDRLCDPDTHEVLSLGADLGVAPTRVEETTGQETQAATLTFSAADAKAIATFTAAHVGDRLAVADGLVLVTAPTIQSAITGGSILISGNFSTRQAAAMVGTLQLAAVGATISSHS